MRASPLVALGCVAVLSLCAAAPAPANRFPHASVTTLGTTQLIDEGDADASVTGVQLFVAAGLDREATNQSGLSALVAECVLRTPVAGLPVRDAVAARGASLAYTVDGRSVHYYIEARAADVAEVVAIVGRALAAPSFTPATVAAARASLLQRIDESQNNALAVGIQMFRRSYYTSQVGDSALGSPTTLASYGSRDVAAFYAATYKRAAFRATTVGRSIPGLGTALADIANKLPEGPLLAPDARVRAIPAEAPRIVAHRDVGAPWIVVGFAAPSPGSADFGAMLVMQSLLSDTFERSSTTTLGFVEKSVGAIYLHDSTPAGLVVYVNGTLVDPSVALRELLVVAQSLSAKPIGDAPLKKYKAAAEGQFLNDSVDLSDRSYLLGSFASQGLSTDAMNDALAALEATTPADVQRVAKRYLQHYIVALVLPRDAAPTAKS